MAQDNALRTARRLVGLCLRPFSTGIGFWDYAQNVVILGIIVGLVPFDLVDQKHVSWLVDHVPGGRPTTTVSVLLALVTVVAVRLIHDQIKHEDWDSQAQRLHERIKFAVALENRFDKIMANDRVSPPPSKKEVEDFTEVLLYWLADFIDWGLACAADLESDWGIPQARRFEVLVMPVTRDVLTDRDLITNPTNALVYRDAVVKRREYLDELMGKLANKV